MELKNRKIELFGTIWSIKYVDSLSDGDAQLYGITNPVDKVIYIAKNMNNTPIIKNELELTLLHELTHAILMTGQYMEENDNEALVEWVARCVYQLIKKNII